jgi:hypothetical protein
MTQKMYRVRVVRGGEELEVEGDKAFVLQILARFDGKSDSGKVAEKPSRAGSSRAQTTKDFSTREFIQRLGLKKHTDIGLAFGYYLEKYLGKNAFTAADINNCYYEAKMEPSNTSQVIIQNTRSGRIMAAKRAKGDSGGRQTYVVTQTGEDFISKKLDAVAK